MSAVSSPLVSNIWTQWDSYKYANGDTRKTFTCHFMKYRESSTRQKENVPNEKYRITKIQPSGLYFAKIKVSWIVSSKVVQKEAVKNYSPPAITAAVKEYVMIKLDLGECLRELKFENYRVPQWSTKGIVFAHPEQLKKLEHHGNEDGDTVMEALIIIKNKYCHWSPCYILSDYRNIEAKGIKKAFSSIIAGEQKCQMLLCVVHVMRTWMQRICKKKTWNVIIAAIHKRTKISCEGLIQDTINNCSVPVIQNYIKRNYVKNIQQ
ncbi:hypothetical protein Glove_63g14 [Diversispora epigaea]|uniref:MULE transposase domain-containing protein n=1 Tax=Diversispora epigaea TaxID=1348612 RepID=A0A397JL49_9GLOM|nr:hypothetical protein Glove_63g14 [Diversispora epigaea]